MPPRSAPLPGPAPVTKNVILGACGNAAGAGCCCALTADVTPSASAAIISTFDLLISILPWCIATVAEFRLLAPPYEQAPHRLIPSTSNGRRVAETSAGLRFVDRSQASN